MKVLFLDIDGVCNNKESAKKYNFRGSVGIDPELAFMVGKIVLDTGCEVVLSSTWRLWEETKQQVFKQVYPFIDITPDLRGTTRGEEIQAWLDKHPEVVKYAILDDDTDMLDNQLPHFFQTSWETGITKEIADKVTNYLNENN